MRRITTVLAGAALLTFVGCGKRPTGAYDTRYGAGTNGANAPGAVEVTVTLQRKGDKVTGSYEGARKGSVDGKLSGHELRGTWSEGTTPNANGTFTWDFTQDWANFSGSFKARDGIQTGSWNGQKK
ncbi:MAG TPA: hypothetical protein VN947_00410 [Polyangia bacterium]|nr:hypothetical protein [Polyangia bacterium]